MMSRNREVYLKDCARSKVMCTGEYRLQVLSVVCENSKIKICKQHLPLMTVMASPQQTAKPYTGAHSLPTSGVGDGIRRVKGRKLMS